jgi:hypothetical protein
MELRKDDVKSNLGIDSTQLRPVDQNNSTTVGDTIQATVGDTIQT